MSNGKFLIHFFLNMFKGAICEERIKTEIIHLVKVFKCGLFLN